MTILLAMYVFMVMSAIAENPQRDMRLSIKDGHDSFFYFIGILLAIAAIFTVIYAIFIFIIIPFYK